MMAHFILFIDLSGWYLISSDGYLMHGVVDRLQQLQHGVQSLPQFTAVSLLRAVFQQLLNTHTHTHVDRSVLLTLFNLVRLDLCLHECLRVKSHLSG